MATRGAEVCTTSSQRCPPALHRDGWAPVARVRSPAWRRAGGRKPGSWRCCVESEAPSKAEPGEQRGAPTAVSAGVEKQVSKFTRSAATTFAPRPSGATKNPAYRGSILYSVFEYQAWLSILVGALLSFNIIFPTDKPSIARLMGMWSIWMFTVPSLRARECLPAEKDALNLLFLLIPVINVALPFAIKDFGFIFSADVVALLGILAWKGSLPGQAGSSSQES